MKQIYLSRSPPMTLGLPPEVAFDGEELVRDHAIRRETQPDRGVDSYRGDPLCSGYRGDTGSLSYVSTTPRDVRAAAWLLEKGASLEVVNDFLRYPLTPLQHALYDRLNQNLETFDFSGQSVIIARAHMVEYVDEISVLAHHLQDYIADALFSRCRWAITSRWWRSTTSAINVADTLQFSMVADTVARCALIGIRHWTMRTT